MGHKTKNLKMQMSDILTAALRRGEGVSKHQLKKDSADLTNIIFSYNTFHTYKNICFRFADWLKETHPDVKTLSGARFYADEWIKSYIDAGYSAYTQSTYISAIAKVFGEPMTNFQKGDTRNRINITRSRCRAKRDVHFSESNNADLVNFCKSTGLRRHELESVHGDWLRYIDGTYYIDLTIRPNCTKGGKGRLVPVIGDIELVVRMCRNAGTRKVFDRISTACDVHSYRACYACSAYTYYCGNTDVKSLPRSKQYVCRGDMAGVVLSRDAMLKTSQALGHNRIDVIAQSYLYNLKK